MYSFVRDKNDVICRIDSDLDVSKSILLFRYECEDEHHAELLKNHLNRLNEEHEDELYSIGFGKGKEKQNGR